MIKNLWDHYKKILVRDHWPSLVGSIVFFASALLVQRLVDIYLSSVHGTAVGDIILDHIPTIDLDPLIIQGTLILSLITILSVLYKPQYLSFGLKSLSLLIIARAFFVSLTHLGVDPHQLVLDAKSFGFNLYNNLYNTSGDFFFSAHTGEPFLGALVFWRDKKLRFFFLFASAFLGVSMLLAHIHYSVDVFAAPFITYSIFAISKKIFKRDYDFSMKY